MRRQALPSAVTFIIAGVLALAGCSANSGEPKGGSESGPASGGKPLVVAMELAYPPFETKNQAGEPEGVAPDFMRDFAEQYDYDLTIENTAFDGLIPMLQTGKADAVMSSMTITEDRAQSVDFTHPYARAQMAILPISASDITDIADLNAPGKTVAVKTGSTRDVFATKNLPEAQIVRLADESAAVTEVVQGKADAFLSDQLTIYRNQQRNPETTTAVFIPFQDPEFWGIAAAKGNDELREQLNEFIASYSADGGFDRITDKYLSDEKQAFDDLGFTWFFTLD